MYPAARSSPRKKRVRGVVSSESKMMSLFKPTQIDNAAARILRGVASIVQQVADEGTPEAREVPLCERRFVGTLVPDLSLQEYVYRVSRYCGCSSSCWVAALIYTDRVLAFTKSSPQPALLDHLSMHRHIITGLVCAIKYHDDRVHTNAFYANVGGVQVQELNKLELAYCTILNWNFHIAGPTFDIYFEQLLQQSASCAVTPQQNMYPSCAVTPQQNMCPHAAGIHINGHDEATHKRASTCTITYHEPNETAANGVLIDEATGIAQHTLTALCA
jgi:hypothetical protein